MAKRAKYLGKCSFMETPPFWGSNEEPTRSYDAAAAAAAGVPLKCLCHIRSTTSLKVAGKTKPKIFATKLQVKLKQLEENSVQ